MKHELILNYIDHLQNADYFDYIFSELTVSEIIQTISELLQLDTREAIHYTCVFIRDVILLAPHSPPADDLRTHIYQSEVIPNLERLVSSRHYLHRRNAIFTLGKIGSVNSLPVLHQAVYQFHHLDPMLLPQLIGEIYWLETNKILDLLAFISKSTNYVARWSLLGILSSFFGVEDWINTKKPLLEALQQETNPLIQQEARYVYNQSLLAFRRKSLSRAKKKQLRQKIRALEPEVMFTDIDIWFHNYLYVQNKIDYSVDELDRFIEIEVPRYVLQRRIYRNQHAPKKPYKGA